MDDGGGRSASWLMADGAASISASMLLAVLINATPALSGLWVFGFLHELTKKDDGVIIVATLLLLPASFLVYGGSQVIFAAKEAVEKRAMEKGRKVERERIEQILKEHGVPVPPEISNSEGTQGAQQDGVRKDVERGRHQERERFRRELAALAERGIRIPPEVAIIAGIEPGPCP